MDISSWLRSRAESHRLTRLSRSWSDMGSFSSLKILLVSFTSSTFRRRKLCPKEPRRTWIKSYGWNRVCIKNDDAWIKSWFSFGFVTGRLLQFSLRPKPCWLPQDLIFDETRSNIWNWSKVDVLTLAKIDSMFAVHASKSTLFALCIRFDFSLWNGSDWRDIGISRSPHLRAFRSQRYDLRCNGWVVFAVFSSAN